MAKVPPYINRYPELKKRRVNGLVPVCSKNLMNDSSTVGVTGGITTRVRFTAVYDATGLALLYGNFYANPSSADNTGTGASALGTLTLNHSIALPSDTSLLCRVGGLTITPGNIAVSSASGIDVNSGDSVFVRTWHNADSATYYPFGYGTTNAALGEGRTTGSDVSNSGSVSTGNTGGLAPIMVLGYPDTDDPRAIVLVGDSIAAGVGDVVEAKRGFVQIATGTTVPLVNLALSGEQSANFSGRGCQYRLSLAAYGTGAIVEYGTNDIYVGFVTAETLKARVIGICNLLKAIGLGPVYVTTLVPRTTSTDYWQTASNQSTITSGGSIDPEAERVAYNNWVRGGSITPFDGYFDTAALVEANASNVLTPNGGYWYCGSALVNGTASAGDSSTLTDSSKSWTVNAYAGMQIVILSGTGAGQTRGIISNTATQATVSAAWSTPPDATSVYRIFDGPTVDGIHPTTSRHVMMAAAVNVGIFLA